MKRAIIISVPLVFTMFLAITGGCAAGAPTPLEFGLRRINSAQKADILVSAEAVLKQRGFALIDRDLDAGTLRYGEADGSATADGRRFSSKMTQRRVVEVRVYPTDGAYKIFCRVSIQRQATEAYRAIAFAGGRGDDRPGHTAIDRDAATTTDQNTVWQIIGRDKSTEQTLLDEITAGVSGS